jgi:glucokinase
MRVLAGDVGGTTTRLCIAECGADGCRTLHAKHFPSGAYAGLSAVLREFLRHESAATLDAVCLAVAGPIRATPAGPAAKVTNLPWEIEAAALAQAFGFARVRLINDFEAVGHGVAALATADLLVLQEGRGVAHGPRAVIGAGTGLGQAILVWQDDRYAVISTEGGHADFGPTDAVQLELAGELLARHGHSSYELLLSGSGLARLYEFLRARVAAAESPAVARAMTNDDPAAAITQAALNGGDPLARRALELFVTIYGAQAGNLALTAGATGGVYVAGGIAPRVLPAMPALRAAFVRAFCNKGNMQSYVAAIPVRLVTNTDVGMLGALRVATEEGAG